MEIDFLKQQEDAQLVSLARFIEHFNIHYSLLLKRYFRFKEISKNPDKDIDIVTYLDMIVVQLRALCIENSKLGNNYTAQNLLRRLGENELADSIDTLFNELFIPESDFTIRKALKTFADGFICHYDSFEGERSDGWGMASVIETRLKNPFYCPNLDYIMNKIITYLGKGLTIQEEI